MMLHQTLYIEEVLAIEFVVSIERAVPRLQKNCYGF